MFVPILNHLRIRTARADPKYPSSGHGPGLGIQPLKFRDDITRWSKGTNPQQLNTYFGANRWGYGNGPLPRFGTAEWSSRQIRPTSSLMEETDAWGDRKESK